MTLRFGAIILIETNLTDPQQTFQSSPTIISPPPSWSNQQI